MTTSFDIKVESNMKYISNSDDNLLCDVYSRIPTEATNAQKQVYAMCSEIADLTNELNRLKHPGEWIEIRRPLSIHLQEEFIPQGEYLARTEHEYFPRQAQAFTTGECCNESHPF